MTFRLGLLAILPIVALVVYLDGQDYDPEALTFSVSSGPASQQYLPPNVGDLLRTGQVRLYSKDNLFEYINGHAEFFISAGFRSLVVAGYKPANDTKGLPIYTIDIFDMGSPENAFGVLTRESAGQEPVDIGYIGFKSSKSIAFIKGSYFIKVASFEKGADAFSLAKAIDANIKSVVTDIPQFVRFPTEGAASDGRSFIRSDYMGLGFLKNVFEQRYERGGKGFHAFLVIPDEGPALFIRNMTASIRDIGATVSTFNLGGKAGWEINDKYEGTWALVQTGEEFIGVREIEEKGKRESFLLSALKRQKPE